MLKRLLIAVFVLGLVLALSGTAISDVSKGPLNAVQKIYQDHERFPHISDARPDQPTFKKPADALVEVQMDGGVPPIPGAPSYFCDYDYYYDDTATSVYVWTIPDAYGDDLFNTRFTVDNSLTACTLKTTWMLMYGGYMSGTPDMRIYLWDDDGFGFPNNKLDSADIAYANLPSSFGWVNGDFASADWVFTSGEEYHYGWTVVGGPADVLCGVSDKATGPHVGEERSSEFCGGLWGSMLNDWGVDVGFFIESERCCYDPAFSECEWVYKYTNTTYFWPAPHPMFGDSAYAQMFKIGGIDTLIAVDMYVFDPGDGTFGNDDVYMTIYEDDGLGLPGAVLYSDVATAGTYPAYPAPTSFTLPLDYTIEYTNIHIAFSSSGLTDYESCLSSDGTDGSGRSSSIWTTTWHPMLSGWGMDVQFLVDAYICPDQYSLCGWGPNCITGVNYYWRLPDAYGDVANAQLRRISGVECRVQEVEWFLYDNGEPDIYTDSSEVRLYADDNGLPGAQIAGIKLQPVDYNIYPSPTVVDFTPLDVFVSNNYWIGIHSFAATPETGIRTLSDAGGGGCDRESAEDYQGTWEAMCDGWSVPCDLAFYTYSFHCCEPLPDKECLTPQDWFTQGGNYGRTYASDLGLEDAWCDLTLQWHYEHPAYSVGLGSGPTIIGDYVACNFSAEYQKIDLATQAVAWVFDASVHSSMGDNVRCAPSYAVIDISTVPTEVVFVTAGNTQAVFCLDWNSGAVIWVRDFNTVGVSGLFGQVRWGPFVVANIGGTDVVYWGTEDGDVVAAEAATGTLYTGWATNPVPLGGSTFKSGASDGTQLFFATAPAAGDGDIVALDMATGAINWQLSTTGLKATTVYPGAGAAGEVFYGAASYYKGQVYAASKCGAGNYPTDGVFYRVDAASGTMLSYAATTSGNYSGLAVDEARVYVLGRSRWVSPPRGGNLIGFSRLTGSQDYASDAMDGNGFYGEGVLTCEGLPEDQISEKLFTFGDGGYFAMFDAWTGEELFHRRMDHLGWPTDIGGSIALGVNGYMAVSSYWGDLFVLKKDADRARLEFVTFDPKVGVNFGVDPNLIVDFGSIIRNTGCVDLTFSNVYAEDAAGGHGLPAYSAGEHDQDDVLARASRIADQSSRNYFINKFFRETESWDETAVTRNSFDRDDRVNRAAAATPAFLNAIVSPGLADAVAGGDSINLIFDVDQALISRGPNYAWCFFESNDPDHFLDINSNDGNMTTPPEIRATIVGGCLLDSTYLHFGAGGANYQVVYNTGRIGYEHDSDENVYAFNIDGVDAAYYGGSLIYGVSQHEIAMNSPDWTGGTVWEVVSLQADPNWCDASCKPALQTGVALGEYSMTGVAGSYVAITGDLICKTFLDSVQNFDDGGGWDWEYWDAPFDNALTMGLMVNTRTIGIPDPDAGLPMGMGNMTLEIMEFIERNNQAVDSWRLGEYIDYDIGSGDTIALDRSISAGWSYTDGEDGVWGAIKIPYGGCNEAFRSCKGLVGSSALWDWSAYFDSAYYYLSTIGHYSQNTSTGDFEGHWSYAAHDFTPNDTHTVGVARFGLTTVTGTAATPTEVAELSQFVNGWCGFGRGDWDNDGNLTLADIIFLVNYLYNSGPGPVPFMHLGDVDDDGDVDGDDLLYMINLYFNNGPAPIEEWEI